MNPRPDPHDFPQDLTRMIFSNFNYFLKDGNKRIVSDR